MTGTKRVSSVFQNCLLAVFVAILWSTQFSAVHADELSQAPNENRSGKLYFSTNGVVAWKLISTRKANDKYTNRENLVLVLSISLPGKSWKLRIPTESGLPPIFEAIDQDRREELLIPSVRYAPRFSAAAVIIMPKAGKPPYVLEGRSMLYNQADPIKIDIDGRRHEPVLLINHKLGKKNSIWEYEAHPGYWYVARCSKIIAGRFVHQVILRVYSPEYEDEDFRKTGCKN